MSKFERKTIDLDDLQISYRVQGSGRPILLLHGGWMTGKLTWSQHYKRLAEDFLVISPDMRGHGHSNNPARKQGSGFSSYRRLAWDMIEFVGALGLEQKPLIMGHSSGAVISLYMSIYQPDIMARQVLSGVSPFLGTSDKFKQGTQAYFGTTNPNIPPTKWSFIRRHPVLCAKLRNAHHTENWYDLMTALWPLRWSALKLDPSDYKKIICPTLVVNGGNDAYSTTRQACSFTELIDGARFMVVPGQGHMFPIKYPELLHQHALPFLHGAQVEPEPFNC